MKGSVNGRKGTITLHQSYQSMLRKKVYKDIDFFNTMKSINADNMTVDIIMKSLDEDLKLLEEYDIMDYSMLILIEEKKALRASYINPNTLLQFEHFIGQVGIIDYLQNYSTGKKLESTLNSLKKQRACHYSCIPTRLYKERFLEMVKSIFSK